jgi:hypothetical protein
MDDLYGPALGYATPRVPPPLPQGERLHGPSPSLEYPEEPEAMVLPVLAAKDPHILGILERHERREEARPRRGMRKVSAVRSAGRKRGGFVLVTRRTEAEMEQVERAAQVSRWAITNKF